MSKVEKQEIKKEIEKLSTSISQDIVDLEEAAFD
jgi:hypothetical protein